MEGVGDRTWVPGITKLIICFSRHKCMTPKWFKITTHSIIRSSGFIFNIKPQYISTAYFENNHPALPPLIPLPTPLMIKRKHLKLSVDNYIFM